MAISVNKSSMSSRSAFAIPDAGTHIDFKGCPEIATILVLHESDQKEKAINRRFERMTNWVCVEAKKGKICVAELKRPSF